jgi:hypothetical protein
VKLSWLGTAEAEALAHYRVRFTIDRGAQDRGFSFWDGPTGMHISEKMAQHGAPGYVSEVLAHEGGHAIFQLSGLINKTFKDASDAHLTPGVEKIMNETFAGAFGNRAHIALFGYKDQNIDRNLQMWNDMMGSLANDKTFYAHNYRVNTAAARLQLPRIKRVMADDLVPYLQKNFGLLGDSQLAAQLVP